MRIGYIGLGVIGRGMCTHLVKHFGQALVLWNRTPEKAGPLVQEGAQVAATPAELARRCEIVCICVSDTPDVEQVVFGEGGVIEGIATGALIIDFSTISATKTREFAARVKERGATWLDAPVSGGDVGARNGTLTIMVGGRHEDFNRAQQIFQCVGKKIVYMGPIGSGQQTKMANQIAVLGTIASMAEAMTFAQQSGMDVERVLDVIGSGAGGSWSLSNYGPRILKGDLAPGFSAALMAKDLRLVLEQVKDLDGEYPVLRKMAELYEQMVAEGDGALGVHGAVKKFGWQQ